jgi:hypothetical protein
MTNQKGTWPFCQSGILSPCEFFNIEKNFFLIGKGIKLQDGNLPKLGHSKVAWLSLSVG